jgi:LPXTG-site transpeptidase (sortase) family protein
LTIPIIRIYGSNLKEIDFQLKKIVRSRKSKTKNRKLQLSRYSYAKILIIIGVIGIGVTLFSLKKESVPANFSTAPAIIPVQTETKPQEQTNYLEKSKPVSLKIPSIGVSSDIITVGKLPDNSMETPNNGTQVGWYKYSPSPGQVGPSVIVGHVDWISGPAVFWSLRDLKSGDIIKVKRQDKKVVEYKVERIQQFSQDNFPTKAVYGNTDTAALRLITCSGDFDSTTYQYDKNIVVFAKATNI